jgi:DNA-binding Lrp family transcriptional regulator
VGWLKDDDQISLSQFAKITGIERNNCQKILKKLEKKKIIKRCVVTHNHSKGINYEFNNTFAEWRVLSPTTTGRKKTGVVTDNHNPQLSATTEEGLSTTTEEGLSTTTTIDKKENIKKLYKESSEDSLGLVDGVQGTSLSTDSNRNDSLARECFEAVRTGKFKNINIGDNENENRRI